MSLEKVIEYIQEEMKKRELSEQTNNLRKEVYEKIVIKKAEILSLEEAAEALEFVGMDSSFIRSKLEELKKELEINKEELAKQLEALISVKHKDDFVKLLKKTKFINNRAPINHSTFKKANEHVANLLQEVTNEELVLLSPYKVAELVESEKKIPAIGKFVDLYKPETAGTEIDGWIEKFAKKTDEAQQIRVHFTELSSGIFTEDMIQDIAIRWSRMIGLSGNLINDPETQEAVKEAMAIIRKNVAMI